MKYGCKFVLIALLLSVTGLALALTKIDLTQYNGYFAAKQTLTGMKAGEFEITVVNKSGKKVGFQLQSMQKRTLTEPMNGKTRTFKLLAAKKDLKMFPLESGQSYTFKIRLKSGTYRYRCPINPTPWYEFSVL